MVDLASQKSVVVRGEFGDLSVADVLQALSISRQLLSVELFGREGLSGRVTLKGGMILGAELAASDVTGFAALRKLFSEPLETFRVERLPARQDDHAPIARLTAKLVEQYETPPPRPSSRPTPAPPVRATEPMHVAEPPVHVAEPMHVAEAPPVRAPTPVRHEAPPVRAPEPTREHTPEPTPVPTTRLGCPAVAIVSPKGGCGKTTLALHVAIGLAKRGKRIVLVDGDVNGDILSAVASRERARRGLLDIIGTSIDPKSLLIKTRIEGLSILPALGADLDPLSMMRAPTAAEIRRVLSQLSEDADLVLVDTPAGMTGPAAEIIGAASHVIGVLQSEPIASRSFGMFRAFLRQMNRTDDVLGVVINMFDRSQRGSVGAFTEADASVDPKWLFSTTIPRTPALLSAAAQGQPLSALDDHRSLSWLFEMLAEEIDQRLAPAPKAASASAPAPFLL